MTVRSYLEVWAQEAEQHKQATGVCWFLTPKVEHVLYSDLKMWTNHLDHNLSALMSEWFDIRLAEVVILYASKGVTEREVAECLDSLALRLAEEELCVASRRDVMTATLSSN